MEIILSKNVFFHKILIFRYKDTAFSAHTQIFSAFFLAHIRHFYVHYRKSCCILTKNILFFLHMSEKSSTFAKYLWNKEI